MKKNFKTYLLPLPTEIHRRFKETCAYNKTTMSKVINILIENFVNDPKNIEETKIYQKFLGGHSMEKISKDFKVELSKVESIIRDRG